MIGKPIASEAPVCVNELCMNTVAKCCLSQLVTFPTQNDSTLDTLLLTIQILLLYMNHCLILASEHDNVHVQAAMLINNRKHSQIKGKSIAIWKKADFIEVKEDFR